MRPLLHALPFLVTCMALDACSCSGPKSEGLTPSTIEIQGYYGHPSQRVIEFRLDGQPIDKAEASFTVLANPSKAFDLSLTPLSEQAVLTFQTETEAHPWATFGLHYRGHDYTIRVNGTARSVPECEASSEVCVDIVFNVETEACEHVPLSDLGCELTDCANPGACRSGVCVHREIEHEAPNCPAQLPITELVPVWTRVMPPQDWPGGPLVLDEDGNSYFFSLPESELRSLSSAGSLRWTVSYSPEATGTGHTFDIRVVGERVLVLDVVERQLRVFSRDDGTQLWERRFSNPTRMLPTGEVLWLLQGISFPAGVDLSVVNAATGATLAFPGLPRTVNGQQVNYYDLIADQNQHVFLIGTADGGDPVMTMVAAMDASTYEGLWATSVALHETAYGQPPALSGSTLLFHSGLALDVTTRDVFSNDVWQHDLGLLDDWSFALNADASGFLASTANNACLTTVLSHVDVQTGSSLWDCFLGSTFAYAGVLQTTPSGSAVILMISGQGENQRRPSLRIIDAGGKEVLHAVLSFGQTEWPQAPLVAIQGQRLLLSQQDKTSGGYSLVAYDIPELLTK